jgi:hypothetical protein
MGKVAASGVFLFCVTVLLSVAPCACHDVALYLSPYEHYSERFQITGDVTLLKITSGYLIACAGFVAKEEMKQGCGLRLNECHCCYPVISHYECTPSDACRTISIGHLEGLCMSLRPNIRELFVDIVPVKIVKRYSYLDYMSALYPSSNSFETCPVNVKHDDLLCGDAASIRVTFKRTYGSLIATGA